MAAPILAWVNAQPPSRTNCARSIPAFIRFSLALAYAANCEDEKAKKAMNDALKANPSVSVASLQRRLPALIEVLPGLREAAKIAGLPDDRAGGSRTYARHNKEKFSNDECPPWGNFRPIR